MREILFQSVVTPDGRGLVQFKWGSQRGQLTVDEARLHAHRILEAAEAAIHDAAMFSWLQAEGELSPQSAGAALIELRKYRGDSTREDWRGE